MPVPSNKGCDIHAFLMPLGGGDLFFYYFYNHVFRNNQILLRMRKIRMYTVASMDGFISREDGDIDWILEQHNPLNTDYGMKRFLDSVDTILMNRNFYQLLLGYDLCASHMVKPCIMVAESGFSIAEGCGVEYVEMPCKNDYTKAIERVRELKSEAGGDIWLAGDNRLIWAFLEADMVDEIILTMLPVKIEQGAKLFPDPDNERKWQPVDRKYYPNDVVQVTFRSGNTNLN